MIDWAMQFRFFDLSKISVFVLDEADVMLACERLQGDTILIHKYVISQATEYFHLTFIFSKELSLLYFVIYFAEHYLGRVK